MCGCVDAAVPVEYPRNVMINESSVGSTSVELTWNAVSESPDTVRGFFIGYRVCSLPTDYMQTQFGEWSVWS